MTRRQVWYLALCLTGVIEGLLMSGQHLVRGLIFAVPAGIGMDLFLCPWIHGEKEA